MTDRHQVRDDLTLSDVFDLVVQPYGGFVMIGLGVVALGVSAAGYFRYLPRPLSAPIFPPHCLGCHQLTIVASILQQVGLLSIVGGVFAIPHNRRNRIAARSSARSGGSVE